ncbi:hypothetical protein A9Q99_10820 [Gammaproteobacteria bacterium 45_16_T64]|nr:hypothetical protein A9Q99_10820 [Gammaproteobacteria bacterium 45_16_T64]
MPKNINEVHATIDLASQSLGYRSASIAEQMLYYFLQHSKDDISMQEVEAFSADHHINVNDCFSVMSWLQNANVVEKKLYDKHTGKQVSLPSEHSSANTPSAPNNVSVKWALSSAF